LGLKEVTNARPKGFDLVAPTQFAVPVVVGIDGSRAAVEAASWAADEAVSRGVTLRLIYVVDVEADVDRDLDEDPSVVARDWPETQQGLAALRDASMVVRGNGRSVQVETQLRWGDVDTTLLEESARAAMICLGSAGIAPMCHRIVGSTAAKLATVRGVRSR
jgi:nucleotide-binding universal stress UspA family protein